MDETRVSNAGRGPAVRRFGVAKIIIVIHKQHFGSVARHGRTRHLGAESEQRPPIAIACGGLAAAKAGPHKAVEDEQG